MMATVTAKQLRDMPEGDIRQRIAETRKALAEFRLKASQGTIEQPHRARLMRRELARMLTVLRERAHSAEGAGAQHEPPRGG